MLADRLLSTSQCNQRANRHGNVLPFRKEISLELSVHAGSVIFYIMVMTQSVYWREQIKGGILGAGGKCRDQLSPFAKGALYICRWRLAYEDMPILTSKAKHCETNRPIYVGLLSWKQDREC